MAHGGARRGLSKTGLIYNNKKLDHAYVAYKENFIVGLLDSYHGVGMCTTT